jgi:uncharacterized protein YciW
MSSISLKRDILHDIEVKMSAMNETEVRRVYDQLKLIVGTPSLSPATMKFPKWKRKAGNVTSTKLDGRRDSAKKQKVLHQSRQTTPPATR